MNKILRSKFNIIIALSLFAIIAYFLLTFRITDVPPGINGDEAAIGYSAISVSRTGRDAYGRFMPLFTSVLKIDDWKQPVTFYSVVLAFRIFGPSYFLLRTVSVLYVLVSGILIFLLVREILGFKTAILSLFIYITIPIIVIQAHLALENIAPVPFVTLWLLMLEKYRKKQNIKYLVIAAISLGISLYSYFGLRLIMPVLAFMTISLVCYINGLKNFSKNIQPIFIFCLTLAPFLILLLIIKNQYPGAIFGYGRPNTDISYQGLALSYLSSFDPSFLFVRGDLTPYHSTGKHGMFLLATLPLFCLGIFRVTQKKDPFLLFILLTFFLSPLLYSLVPTVYRASRLLVLVPMFVVITSFGLSELIKIKFKYLSPVFTCVILSLVVLNYADFLRDYWYEYPLRVRADFSKPIHTSFSQMQKISKERNLHPLYDEGIKGRDVIGTMFFEKAYFPNGLDKWSINQPLPKDSITLVPQQTALIQSQKEKVEVIKFDQADLALIIKK